MPRKIPTDSDDMDLVFNDVHAPFDDNRWRSMLFREVKNYDFKHIIIAGDILDCYELSKFRKNPAVVPSTTLASEIAYARRNYFAPLRELQPDAEIILMPGNHEDRWRKLLWETWSQYEVALQKLNIPLPEGVTEQSLGDVMGLDEFDIVYHDKPLHKQAIYRLRNKINITHGDIAWKWSGSVAKKFAIENGGFWIVAHTHRLGMFQHTYANGDLCFGWENGCLCQNMEYDATPDWQRGFLVLKWDGYRFMLEPKAWM